MLNASIRIALRATLIIAGLVPSISARAEQESALIAQGEYSAVEVHAGSLPKRKKISQWRVYQRPDGSYSLEIQMLAVAPKAVERLVLNREGKVQAMSLVIPSLDQGTIRISCDYNTVISCSEGASGRLIKSDEIRRDQPYCFLPFREPVLFYDVPWFYQNLASQVPAAVGARKSISLFTLEGGPGSTTDRIQPIAVLEVVYLSREKIEVAGETVSALKYHVRSAKRPEQDLWLSPSGVLLKATAGYAPAVILTAYVNRRSHGAGELKQERVH